MQAKDHCVHLWWADTREVNLPHERDYASWLTDAERCALQQKIPKVREQALAAKLFLKRVLGSYTKQAPRELCFTHNAYGKPTLQGSDLHFNLSHSAHYLVLVICRTVEVGVDVQTMRQSLKPLDIAERFFHGQEYQALRLLAQKLQTRYFFRLWSAKEAVLKAAGVGIGASGLKDIVFHVPLNPTSHADQALKIDRAASIARFQGFHLQEFFWLPEAAFSLATLEATQDLQTFHWQGKLDEIKDSICKFS